MARLDVRCDLRLPVEILFNSGQGDCQHATTANIGLGGAFISSDSSLPENSVVKLRAQIPNYGVLETKGKVLRTQGEGFALKFLNLDDSTKMNLWDYISLNLYDQPDLPGERKVTDLSAPPDLPEHRAGEISLRLDILDKATEGFNNRLADIEQRYHKGESSEALLKEVSASIYEVCDVCRGLEEAIGEDLEFLRKTQTEFRAKTELFFSKSYLMNRARTWPQGYPGDFKIIESIYRNIPLSVGVGYLLDLHFLSATLAVAVRERLTKLEELLREELLDKEKPKVLNIACGSCREIFELVPEIEQAGATVTCLDSDSDALAFAYKRLSYAGEIWSGITMRKYNAVRMINHERNLKEFGPQDIIYSIGLVNYLQDDMLIRLLESLYALLRPKGKLIVGIEDGSRYRPQEYHWFVDWASLIRRTEHDCRVIFGEAGIPEDSLSLVRDRSGVIIFCIAERR